MPGKCEVCECEALVTGLRVSRLTLDVCRVCLYAPFMDEWRESRRAA